MKTALVCGICLVSVVVVSLLIKQRFVLASEFAETHDILGQILVAADKSLFADSITEYDPVKMTRSVFPSVPVVDGHLADAWGRPIEVRVWNEGSNVRIDMRSSGVDGIRGNADDVSRSGTLVSGPGTHTSSVP